MIILGLALPPTGEAAAALLQDQTLVAAIDEAPLSRLAVNDLCLPWESIRFCLQQGAISPTQIDTIAITGTPAAFTDPARWHRLARAWANGPLHAIADEVATERVRCKALKNFQLLKLQCGIPSSVPVTVIPSEKAFTAANYFLSPHHSTANDICASDEAFSSITCISGLNNGKHQPPAIAGFGADSLFSIMRIMASYLGFEGPRALEGLALLGRHGDARRYNLGKLFTLKNGELRCNMRLIDPSRRKGWRMGNQRFAFTQALVDWLGPPAIESPSLDPHAHYAAALQSMLETTLMAMLKYAHDRGLPLANDLLVSGNAAENRYLLRVMQESTGHRRQQTTPITGAAGQALGAAAITAARHGIMLDPLQHAYWGPAFFTEECIAACKRHTSHPHYEVIKSPAKKAAKLLAEGHAVGWFQGRAESCPLALGHRAVLYAANSQQRPLQCQITGNRWTPATNIVISHNVQQQGRYSLSETTTAGDRYVPLTEEARQLLPIDLQINGTAPLHAACKKITPRLCETIDELEKISGIGLVVQMPMQIANTPRACSTTDALDWFSQSDCHYLVMEDLLISKDR